jgi:Uma2 family endonuclease
VALRPRIGLGLGLGLGLDRTILGYPRARLETEADDPHALLNPIVLVEVLSESTEAYDRGAKAAHYRRIASLQEYVLVSQGEPLIEVHRRNERGLFELIEARAGEHAELSSLGVSINVDAVYENPLRVPPDRG